MTLLEPPITRPNTSAELALTRGVDRLRALQSPEGWWRGLLESNVTMDAEDLLLRQFLGILRAEESEAAAKWIRRHQRQDGSWANFHGGPADLSTTVEAYVALRLAGDAPDDEHMTAASTLIRATGGLERARVFTKIWLSLFGIWSWDDVPVLPPELVMLPAWMPLNIYDFACWARQTVVALTVVSAYRPVRPVGFTVDELLTGAPKDPRLGRLTAWERIFVTADRLLHRYERRPLGWLRRRALDRAERWIVDRQERDGSWGGIQPPWVYSIIALTLRGYRLDHPVIARGLAGLDRFTVWENGERWIEACQSPVWDTALALNALLDAGVGGADPAVEQAAAWLAEEEISSAGDWSVRRPSLAPSGWAFEFDNDVYPDVDDTAEVVLALRRARLEPGAAERGAAWVAGMECHTGGWAAFDADNQRELCRKPPFCDFGEVIDPPSADVTAHAVEMLAGFGEAYEAAVQRGVAWLLQQQERDGSWFGRWGANHIYGTAAVVPALRAGGLPASDPALQRAADWIESCQAPDGGWGEDMRSYVDDAWRGRGEPTPSQTAWALLVLIAAERRGAAAEAGIDWLVRHQRSDGVWEEPYFTGTGFPGFFYINYHLYRQVFPVMALGRWLEASNE